MIEDSVTREEWHCRNIDLRFYKRSDELFEVEANLVDTKTHSFRRLLSDVDSPPGHRLHDITVRLVLDSELLIHAAEANMLSTPFGICPGAAGALHLLVGLRIEAGWNKRVRDLLGGVTSCTHIVELLGPMATTAIQGLTRLRAVSSGDPKSNMKRRFQVNSCYAFSAEREVVAQLLPAPMQCASGTP
ncbi:DUF2889 domain-containing protein [Pseudomonas putida]